MICVACILKSDQLDYDPEDIIGVDDLATKCESVLHVDPRSRMLDQPTLSQEVP